MGDIRSFEWWPLNVDSRLYSLISRGHSNFDIINLILLEHL